MPGLYPSLVVHTLIVEPQTKPVGQLARVFHTNVEAQVIQEVQKLIAIGFIKPIQHSKWLSNDNSLILHIYIIIRKHYHTYFKLIHAFYS